MKCYNHPNIDAVAQCVKCKILLCESCRDKSQDNVCSACLKEADIADSEYEKASLERNIKVRQEEYKKYIRNIKISGSIGIVISIFFNTKFAGIHNPLYYAVITLLAAYLSISIYSGYILIKWEIPDLSKAWNFVEIELFLGLLFRVIKLPIAIITGFFGTIPLYLKMRQKYLDLAPHS